MPALEQQLKEQLLLEFPSIWDVDFQHEGGLVLILKALPNPPLCIINISRLVASFISPLCYTIIIHYFWKPIRSRVLFGPEGTSRD